VEHVANRLGYSGMIPKPFPRRSCWNFWYSSRVLCRPYKPASVTATWALLLLGLGLGLLLLVLDLMECQASHQVDIQ